MLFSVDQIIAYVSRFCTLKIGDLLFTGTPVGVGPVQIGNHLDTCGRQRRFYCSISECSIKKNVDDGMRLGKSHRDIGTDFR